MPDTLPLLSSAAQSYICSVAPADTVIIFSPESYSTMPQLSSCPFKQIVTLSVYGQRFYHKVIFQVVLTFRQCSSFVVSFRTVDRSVHASCPSCIISLVAFTGSVMPLSSAASAAAGSRLKMRHSDNKLVNSRFFMFCSPCFILFLMIQHISSAIGRSLTSFTSICVHGRAASSQADQRLFLLQQAVRA